MDNAAQPRRDWHCKAWIHSGRVCGSGRHVLSTCRGLSTAPMLAVSCLCSAIRCRRPSPETSLTSPAPALQKAAWPLAYPCSTRAQYASLLAAATQHTQATGGGPWWAPPGRSELWADEAHEGLLASLDRADHDWLDCVSLLVDVDLARRTNKSLGLTDGLGNSRSVE